MKTKGILLIALGHSNYGRMALNLAVSLKVTDSSTKIALAFGGNVLDDIRHYPIDKYFDELIPVPQDNYMRNGNSEFIRSKLHMYDLSPFDETIFLDVDMLWHPVRSASVLFNALKDVPVTFQNRGCLDLSAETLDPEYSMWADVNEVKSKYKFKEGRYYQLHSEFVYFKKQKKVQKLFDDAKDIYDNLKVKSFVFGGGIPDELPFSISMTKNDTYPHEDNYVPIYWEVTEKKNLQRNPNELYLNFFGYSTGGSFHTKTMKEFYNNLARYYFNKEGLQYPFNLIDKRDYMPTRRNL